MNSSLAVRAHIQDLLDDLGPSAADVACLLDDVGVRGTPNASTDCVLARYLNAVLRADPLVRSVAVTRTHVHVRLRPRSRRRLVLVLPAPLAEFVLGFDAQRYPQLVGAAPAALTPVPQPG